MKNLFIKILSIYFITSFVIADSTSLIENEANGIFSTINKLDKNHAEAFSNILIQNIDGRVHPLHTTAINVLNKVHGKDYFLNLNAQQVFLGMLVKSSLYKRIKFIKLKNKKIKKMLGVNENIDYISFNDVFDFMSEKPYRLLQLIEKVNRKRAVERNTFDKDLIKLDERINVAYMVYTGSILNIFPSTDGVELRWFDPQLAMTSFNDNDSKYIEKILKKYFLDVGDAFKSSNWEYANKSLKAITNWQNTYANKVLPNDSIVQIEIIYNKLSIFKKLTPIYILLAIISFIVFFTQLFNKKDISLILKSIFVINVLLLLTQIIALAIRWYISGHAPWSDAYESMIYIGFSISLAGVIFGRKFFLALPAANVLATVVFFVAHLQWIDPQITNLVPVLKSYWLSIHVSVITGSYGFLGLSFILGFISLILYGILNFKSIKDKLIITDNIKKISKISEASMILGLVMLSIGNFLGGIWANESWGRYWGWDPKETWALISILVYAIIIHLRFIPKLKGYYVFSIASVLGYSSIVMTYLGVNFYLSGLHSYASGDKVPVPTFAYVFVVVVLALIAWGYKQKNAV